MDSFISEENNQLRAGKAKPAIAPKSIINPDLVGTWQHVGSGSKHLIDASSIYYAIGKPTPYTVNATTLDWGGWIFNRLHGTSGLLGVWKEPTTNEEINLRADMSYTWYDPTIPDTFGTYSTTSAPDTLNTTEARAYLIELGNQLVFDAIFSGSYTYDFTVSQTDLVLTDPNNGNVNAYVRI